LKKPNLIKREGKGRPSKDYMPQTKTIYQIKCILGDLDNDSKQKALEQANCFVLITKNDVVKTVTKDFIKAYNR